MDPEDEDESFTSISLSSTTTGLEGAAADVLAFFFKVEILGTEGDFDFFRFRFRLAELSSSSESEESEEIILRWVVGLTAFFGGRGGNSVKEELIRN